MSSLTLLVVLGVSGGHSVVKAGEATNSRRKAALTPSSDIVLLLPSEKVLLLGGGGGGGTSLGVEELKGLVDLVQS
eukprot:m.90894 g.90894  ORF g.90894 m.90894 type:complete len:76 (-) comp15281_c2_seq16:39-266(-)